MSQQVVLLPRPQELTRTGGTVTLADQRLIALQVDRPARLLFAARCVQGALAQFAQFAWEIVGGSAIPAAQVGLKIAIDPSVSRAQGYRLTVSAEGLVVIGHDEAGAYYGVLTLIQLLQQHGANLPAVEINDWPDFPVRGVMQDISRDRVPTIETLYALVDRLATWKINQLQLYTEHTFAYRNHPVVWSKASPITAEEILALDAYCKERFIDLVPNQASFGHMHHWFEHKEYLPLAETEGEVVTPWGITFSLPFSLSPANPDAIPFLAGLFDELLPNFTSQFFNVNCDETFDIGQGRSKELVEQKGKGRVYLDFLLQIYTLVKQRGLTMQFWGDIINKYPDLVPELPKDAIALEWGYEASHDFDGMGALFARSGIPFYVCPGTSSWNTIAGRTDNAIGNIRGAVENGLRHGASGILNTDWGDRGHWQTPPISYLGFAYGAAVGWAFASNTDLDLPAVLDAFAFEDEAGVMGKLAYDLGNTYQKPGVLIHNSNILSWAIHLPLAAEDREQSQVMELLERFGSLAQELAPVEKLHETLAYIDAVMAPLENARMRRPDAGLIKQEFTLAADMMRHGARRLLYVLGAESPGAEALTAELQAIVERYRALWLARSRPGGLQDSVDRMTGARPTF